MGNKILVGSNFAGFKNRIINGGFQVWQRGEWFSGTLNSYTADRMYTINEEQGIVFKGKISSNSVSTVDNIDPFGDSSGVALWTLDGNANDVGGNYNGTWSGTEQYDTGVFGQAAKFDGNSVIDTHIEINSAGTITYSCWFNPITGNTGTWNFILGQYSNFWINISEDTTNDGATANKIIFIVLDGSNWHKIEPSFNYSNGQWYHLLAIVKNNNQIFYINGELIGSLTITKSTDNSYSLNIGSDIEDISGHGVTGLIDQVRIFNRALTEDEIKKLYFEESNIIYKNAFTHRIISVSDPTTKKIIPLEYRFEGQHLYDIVSKKDKLTVSFTMNSNKSGTYAIALQNQTDQSNIETILQEFIYSGNEDKKISVTFDTSLFTTEVKDGENLGLVLKIAGYTQNYDYIGTVGLNSGDKICTSNCVAYASDDFISIEELQLEKGNMATEFEYIPYEIELLRCMRYYETIEYEYSGNTPATVSNTITFHQKRTLPTIIYNQKTVSSSNLQSSFTPLSANSGKVTITNSDTTNTTTGTVTSDITLDAEL